MNNFTVVQSNKKEFKTTLDVKVYFVEHSNPRVITASLLLYTITQSPSLLIVIIDSDNEVTLSWTNNGNIDYDNIWIERSVDGVNYSVISILPLGFNKYSDCSVVPGSYYYRLRYKGDLAYSSYSNVAEIHESDFYSSIGCVVSEESKLMISENNYYYIIKQ